MKKKVIVIGLDGLEPTIVERMLERNDLPRLAKLRDLGFYGRLRTTYPAQTPVAWSSFVTGTNPGGHGIFDFIRRDPTTYRPDLALTQFEPPKNKFSLPRVVSRRKGVPIWKRLTKAGVQSVVLRCPCAFPPEDNCGKILAGVGVPDLRGGQGTGTFYTQDRTKKAKEHEQVIHLSPGIDLKTHIVGPRSTRVAPYTDLTAELRVQVDEARRALVIETGGTPSKLEVAENTWSPWVRVKFKVSVLQSVSGIVRFYVNRVSLPVEFYSSPVNFDPASPLFPVSAPASYARELSERIGVFSTLGMAEDHTGLNNGRLDEAAYLAQCDSVFEEREKMMFYELDRFSEGFFFTLFDTPDRLQHMFWRFRDPEHPLYNAEMAAQMAGHVEDLYRRCDKLLGRVLDKVDENSLLIVLSDHGFNSFRRAFDTNTWLWQQGLLTLRNGKRPSEELGDSFQAVDWSKTHAYGIGLGGIYLNFRGREKEGILEEGSSDAETVSKSIEKGLAGFVDVDAQRVAIHNVSRREHIYSGPYVADAPDLLVNFHPGYRVSWQTAMGGFADSMVSDNNRSWSGDHIIDPEAVPGILFMNHKPRHDNARMIDMAPTILSYLNVPMEAALDGESLL